MISTFTLRWWQVPYFWAGIKMYDLVAGKKLLKPSYYMTKNKTIEEFPMIKRDNLCGAIVYYDGEKKAASYVFFSIWGLR